MLTASRLVDFMISLSPMHTPCLSSLLGDLRPSSRMGMISGRIFSPNFRTRSPSVLAAICQAELKSGQGLPADPGHPVGHSRMRAPGPPRRYLSQT